MQENPAPADDLQLARAIRDKAVELGALVGVLDGTPWLLEVRFESGKFLNVRRHQGPLKSDEELEALARAVGVLSD